MSIKTAVESAVSNTGVDVNNVYVSKDHMEHGVPSVLVNVNYTAHNKTYDSSWAFAKANGMDEEHIAIVVASFVKVGLNNESK